MPNEAPHSLSAERAVLGGLLLNNAALRTAGEAKRRVLHLVRQEAGGREEGGG